MYRLIAYRGFESPSLRQEKFPKPRKFKDLRGFCFFRPANLPINGHRLAAHRVRSKPTQRAEVNGKLEAAPANYRAMTGKEWPTIIAATRVEREAKANG